MRRGQGMKLLHQRYPAGLTLTLSLLLVACEVPEAPEWNVGVRVPFSSDPLTIVDFLPSDVDTATVAGEPVFEVDPQGAGVAYSLGQMCPDCGSYHDLPPAPVPGFDYSDSLDVAFTEPLVAIEVVTASLGLSLQNGLNFDPLRPDPDPDVAGFVAIVARDIASGAELDSVHVSGATDSLPMGERLDVQLQLSDVTLTRGIRVVTHFHSPADGQTVAMDTTDTAAADALLDDIAVAAVTGIVDVDTLEESFAVDVDADFRDNIDDRAEGGSFQLELTHDLDIQGTLAVSIAGSPADLFSGSPTREVQLLDFDFSFAPDGRTASSDVTGQELDFIASLPEVYLGYRGVASGASTDALGRPVARFTPGQSIETRFQVEARVRVGE